RRRLAGDATHTSGGAVLRVKSVTPVLWMRRVARTERLGARDQRAAERRPY
ncbi:unnamed protein product, partial [Urochloa humidicola]